MSMKMFKKEDKFGNWNVPFHKSNACRTEPKAQNTQV